MSNKELLKDKRKEEVYQLVETLYHSHHSFQPLIEDLHTLVISPALDETGANPDVIASYSNIRHFLQKADNLYQKEK